MDEQTTREFRTEKDVVYTQRPGLSVASVSDFLRPDQCEFCHYGFSANRRFRGKNILRVENFRSYLGKMFSGQGSLVAISIKNSLLMYVINLAICMPLYILFSYMLYKRCFLHKSIRFIVMIPQVVSSFVHLYVFKNFTGRRASRYDAYAGDQGLSQSFEGRALYVSHQFFFI